MGVILSKVCYLVCPLRGVLSVLSGGGLVFFFSRKDLQVEHRGVIHENVLVEVIRTCVSLGRTVFLSFVTSPFAVRSKTSLTFALWNCMRPHPSASCHPHSTANVR